MEEVYTVQGKVSRSMRALVCVSVHTCTPVVGKEHVSDPVAHTASSAGVNLLIKTGSELLC